jgi:hypothetical protein
MCAVALQDRWWYRGVYSVVHAEGGEEMAFTLDVFNVAPSGTRPLILMIRLQEMASKRRAMFRQSLIHP